MVQKKTLCRADTATWQIQDLNGTHHCFLSTMKWRRKATVGVPASIIFYNEWIISYSNTLWFNHWWIRSPSPIPIKDSWTSAESGLWILNKIISRLCVWREKKKKFKCELSANWCYSLLWAEILNQWQYERWTPSPSPTFQLNRLRTQNMVSEGWF